MADTDLTSPFSTPGENPDAAPYPRGTPFGRYVMLDRIGRGGAGDVYVAYDADLDRRIALKLLHTGSAPDDATESVRLPRLVREAQILAKLSHPNVLVVHDVGADEGRPFIATEFVDGHDLEGWLETHERPWPEILQLFAFAGRGLAAAHEAGVIHGDFKPSNVLVGSDGRPRIGDFGVARLRAAAHGGTGPHGDDTTTTGNLVGTPYYMAPEQFDGDTADERSDQYAFCLALYEALYRFRAFRGKTVTALAMDKRERAPTPPASSPRIPSWLREIVTRGFATDPQARYDKVADLLVALDRGRSRVRRRRVGVAVAGAAGVGLALGYGTLRASDDACTGSDRHLDGVWDDAARDRVAEAFGASDRTYAARTLTRTGAVLDDYARHWTTAHRQVCEAGQYQEQSATLLDARMRCLDDRLAQLSATAKVLETGSDAIVDNAVAAVQSLPAVGVCADLERVVQEFDAPSPAIERAVTEIRRELAQVDTLERFGEYTESSQRNAPLVVRAEQLGDPAIVAEVQARTGRLAYLMGDLATAEAELSSAIAAAVAHRRDRTALDAGNLLILVLGQRQARYAEAETWAKWVEALAMRIDAGPRARAELLHGRGAIATKRGKLAAAIEHYEEALSLIQEAAGPDSLDTASIESSFGEALRNAGEGKRAREVLEHSLKVTERELGDDHTQVAAILNVLGTVLADAGELESGRKALDRALAIGQAGFGPNHPGVGMIQSNRAVLLWQMGETGEARECLREVLAIQEQTLGPDHPEVGIALLNLAGINLESGAVEDALPLLDRAEAIEVEANGDVSPGLASILDNRALALGLLKRPAKAKAAAKRAIEVTRAAVGDDHPQMASAMERLGWVHEQADRLRDSETAYVAAMAIVENTKGPPGRQGAEILAALGHVRFRLGRHDDAVADLERALTMTDGGGPLRAQIEFDLAQTLWEQGHDRERARGLAKGASEAYASAQRTDDQHAVDQWLAKRG